MINLNKLLRLSDKEITGEKVYAELFVAVLGASSYTFATALASQGSEDWIRGHIRAFEYFGGCPSIVVPDNLKSGVKRACIYGKIHTVTVIHVADGKSCIRTANNADHILAGQAFIFVVYTFLFVEITIR